MRALAVELQQGRWTVRIAGRNKKIPANASIVFSSTDGQDIFNVEVEAKELQDLRFLINSLWIVLDEYREEHDDHLMGSVTESQDSNHVPF